jgi:hypothetical protein
VPVKGAEAKEGGGGKRAKKAEVAAAAESEDEQKKIYEGVFDLTKVFTLKSYDELKQMLDEHYYCKSAQQAEQQVNSESASRHVDKDEAPPFKVTQDTDTSMDDIDELLRDL